MGITLTGRGAAVIEERYPCPINATFGAKENWDHCFTERKRGSDLLHRHRVEPAICALAELSDG